MSLNDQLDLQSRKELVAALLACRCLETPAARELVLHDLPVEIRHHFKRFPTDWQDVDSLVSTCLQSADGLKRLFEIVEYQEGNSLAWQRLQQIYQALEQEQTKPAVTSQHRLHLRCDRTVQGEAFVQAFRSAHPARPFVCLIHGDEDEAHHDFVTRLQSEILPGLCNDQRVMHRVWEVSHPHAAVAEYWRRLSQTFDRNKTASPDCRKLIEQELACEGGTVLLHLPWLSENFEAARTSSFTQFLAFWESWTTLPENCRVVCVVTLKYQRSRAKTGLRFWRKPLNHRIQRAVTELAQQSAAWNWFEVLPQLHAISRHEAETWSAQPEVLAIRDVREEVSELYRRLQDGRILLSKLSPELKNLLDGKGLANPSNLLIKRN